MLDGLASRLTYANVMATLAFFMALGGGAYAVSSLPRNSVGTPQLKNGAVSTSKLASHAVTGSKVAKGSLTGADINASTLGTVPSATNAANAAHASSADTATSAGRAFTAGAATTASEANNSSQLDGLGSSQFVQGGGTSFAGRATLVLGEGAMQHILTIPQVGEVVGGCGSTGGTVGFVNHSGHSLRVFPFAGTELPPETIANGASSGQFPSGFGSAGYTFMQIGSTEFTNQSLLTVIATRDAQAGGQCPVQAWAVTR